jgi:hypothetical protein
MTATVVAMGAKQSIHGREVAENPPNRFVHTAYERDADWDQPDDPAPKTQFYGDASTSIITHNDSPDVGFTSSINPYRGCEHGCLCYFIIPPSATYHPIEDESAI